MANDFSRDTFCRALYRFEAGAFLVDSKGNNTLTNHGSVAESATCKEGSKAADFEDSLSQYFSVEDAALDAGFPLKSGDTLKIGSFALWFRAETSPGSGNYDTFLGKWHYGGNNISLTVYLSNGYLCVGWGYGTGTSAEYWSVAYLSTFVGKWYHVGISFDGVGKTCHARIYDATAGTVSNYDKTFTNELRICDAPFTIGSQNGSNFYDGILDELVVFNRRLADVEFDNIRNGLFRLNDFSQDTRIAGQWRFEKDCNDERNGNHLTLNGSAVWTSETSEGQYAIDLLASRSNYLYRNDADLATGFPLKSGDPLKKFAFCIMFKHRAYSEVILASKYKTTGNKRSLAVLLSGGSTPRLYLGYNNGASAQTLDLLTSHWYSPVTPNYWAFLGVSIDGVNKYGSLYVWTAYPSAYRPMTQNFTFTNELYVCDASFSIGLGTDGVTASCNTLISQAVVYNDLLSEADFERIRQGWFSGPPAGGPVPFAVGVQAAYSLVPEDAYVGMHAGGIQVAYSTEDPTSTRRVFPVPTRLMRWQTQWGKRKFPATNIL